MSESSSTKPDTPAPVKGSTIQCKEPWTVPIPVSLLRDGSVGDLAKNLYCILKSYVRPDCLMPFPSIQTLCRDTGRYRETVQKSLKELETHGLLVRHAVKDAGKFHSTRYELLPHKIRRKIPHRSGKRPLRSKAATNTVVGEFHSREKGLIRKTPYPESSTPREREPMHPSHCHCYECRESER